MKINKNVISVIVLIVIIISVLAISFYDAEKSAKENDDPILEVSVTDIEKISSDMTDAQWDNYKEGLIGKRVEWKAKINNVSSDGDMELEADYGEFFPDVSCRFNVSPEQASSYNKNEVIMFKGTFDNITKSSSRFVMIFRSVEIEDSK